MTYDNQVRADGRSRVPQGIEDLTSGDGLEALDPELDAELEEKLASILELSEGKSKARFKLEVIFAQERSRMDAFTGIIVAWTNGGFASGGGDEAVYFCTGLTKKSDYTKACNAPLDLKFISREVAVCPTCRNVLDPKKLTGQVMATLTSQNWALLLTRMFTLLEANADIRMGFMPGDLRGAAKAEQDKTQRGEGLTKVRLDRTWVIYTLEDIIKDTAAGSSLYKRIRVFLEA